MKKKNGRKRTQAQKEEVIDYLLKEYYSGAFESDLHYSQELELSVRQIRRYKKALLSRIHRQNTEKMKSLKDRLNEKLCSIVFNDTFIPRKDVFAAIDRLMKLNRLGEAPEPGE
ncbi:MAG: hypothetical protein KDK45_24215 [Leptospiraceae bacterium]|nr:hypothetical protein [Leptospiraceae bacterium]